MFDSKTGQATLPKRKITNQRCRSGPDLPAWVATTCLGRELSAGEFQDLLRRASSGERVKDAAPDKAV